MNESYKANQNSKRNNIKKNRVVEEVHKCYHIGSKELFQASCIEVFFLLKKGKVRASRRKKKESLKSKKKVKKTLKKGID